MAEVDGPNGPPGCWPEFADARFGLFLRYWAERRTGLAMPRRAIDPTILKPCLPHVYLMRYDAAADLFVCTLSGEKINEAWGTSLMHKTPQQFMAAPAAARAQRIYRRIVTEPAVHVGHRHRGAAGETAAKAADRLVVPLCDDAGRPWGLFGLSLYHFNPVTEAEVAPHIGPEVTYYPCKDLPRDPPPASLPPRG
ncbi:MAG TPA: PAS domain-containing protein [Ferrovibrio sp.]|uniref:PAS domain-containing protein n=1 Tax=Ferrovibrio sp. TaxID=1917215 RepID=UPI002ED18F8C